jgi:alkylation response protein AidB-like acyl-CoA dehydrogenase
MRGARHLARGLGARLRRARHARIGHDQGVICSAANWRVVDRSMQILGGLGITDDTIVARLFRKV